MKYKIRVYFDATYEVEADSEEQAIDIAVDLSTDEKRYVNTEVTA